jgi:hypothetical protein
MEQIVLRLEMIRLKFVEAITEIDRSIEFIRRSKWHAEKKSKKKKLNNQTKEKILT